MTDPDVKRANDRRYHRQRNLAIMLLISEHRARFRELMRQAEADTAAVTAERRAVLFAETAPVSRRRR